VTDTFILKGINVASIGNALEYHVIPVRETRATGKCIFTEKAPIKVQLRVLKFPYLENDKSYESGNAPYFLNLRPLVKFSHRSDLPFLRYGHFFVAKILFSFLLWSNLAILQVEKNSLDPGFE
jgi:hypothetical protein